MKYVESYDRNNKLTPSETVVMKAIWDEGKDIAFQDLLVRLKENFDRPYARTTVITFLGKMEKKGFVSTYKIGKFAYLHAEKEEEPYKLMLIEEDLDFWYDGKPSLMLLDILRLKINTKEETRKMLEIVRAREREFYEDENEE